MRKFRFSRFLLISVVTLVCVASLIFFILKHSKDEETSSKSFNQISLIFSSTLSYPISNVKSFLSDFMSIDDLRAENLKLQERLSTLEPYEEKIKTLISENEALKATLGLKDSFLSKKVLSAKVIERSSLAWLDWISLDIGKVDGVNEDMLVVSEGYLVGIIDDISDSFSNVHLLSNTSYLNEIPVKIITKTGNVFGILSGFDPKKEAYLITKLNKKLDIETNDCVLTSGLDGKTVADVRVGKVTEVISEDELNRKVYVTPGSNFDNITYVNLIGVDNGEN